MTLPSLRRLAGWRILVGIALIVLATAVMIRSDLGQVRRVSELSLQGSPAPERDAASPTGYVLGQRYFLGKYERGETYRWIAATQDILAHGPFSSATYHGDTVPTGRPQLLPKLYAGWLATVAWGLHAVTGEPVPICVERAALWEPVISHVLAFVAATVFMALRFGPLAAGLTALVFAWFPPVYGQFVPGVLSARSWALLLAAYAIALALPAREENGPSAAFSVRAAIAAGFALWLDPAFGFPAVLVAVSVGAALIAHGARFSCLRWSLIGAGLTLVAWLVDRGPWAAAAGELRYVHPLYALAWLGLGLALDGAGALRIDGRNRKRRIVEITLGALLVAPLVYVQIAHGYMGWIYPSLWMRRFTALDEVSVFGTAGAWLGQASAAEAMLILLPLWVAGAALGLAWLSGPGRSKGSRGSLIPAAVAFAALLVLAFFRLRWGVVAALVALPLAWRLLADGLPRYRRTAMIVAGLFVVGLIAWNQHLPATFKRPSADDAPTAADLDALVYRHFSYWLATHSPGQKISALAPPELSDSIVFHGGGRVLMSTAWESYPGQLAARRILSALEATEAEAVLQGRELTHLVLPSWDKVLPLFVQKPTEKGKDTLFERLDRWVYPPYLRPLAYRLPPLPAYAAQKLAVFKVTAPQEEPLLLARLAEYFIEMDRTEPATMVARVLAQSYADDPNAAIGRATVYSATNQRADFDRELARLAADARAERSPFSWDRRVQRAIVLALGRQRELARKEVEACLATVSESDLLELTPLQAYRLTVLARAHELQFPDPKLAQLAASLGAEYHQNPRPATEH